MELLAITAGDDPDDVLEPKVRSVITTDFTTFASKLSSIVV